MTDSQRDPILFTRNLFLPDDLGGNRYPYEVVQRLGRRGYPVSVVTPRLHDRFPPLQNVSYDFYPISRRHPLLTHLTNVASATVALRRHRGRRYPVALTGSYDTALAFSFAGLTRETPLVFLFHSEFYSEWVQALGSGPKALARRGIRAYMAAVERRVFTDSARLVAVSEFSARQMRERAPWASHKVRVVSTGVDTTYFEPPADKKSAKRAIGQPDDEVLFLGVGRLVAVKQFDRLIQAFATASQNGLSGARLVIAGGGPDGPCLERLASELGVADRVTLAGYCDPPRLRAFMQAADLQVCSSAFENFSLAILEGLASGTPVLGTPGGGTPELVGAVDRSLVLDADTPEAIAAGLQRVAADPVELRRLGQVARNLAAGRFDWERVVDQLLGVCADVRR